MPCSNHIIRECTVDFRPIGSDGFGKLILTEVFANSFNQCSSHAWEIFGLDSILDVLSSEFQQHLGQKFNVGSQHAERPVNHFDKVLCVSDKSFVLEDRIRSGIDRFRNTKYELNLWFKDKQFSKELHSDNFLVVGNSSNQLPSAEDIIDRAVGHIKNHLSQSLMRKFEMELLEVG